MKTSNRLEHYYNEQETERNTDVATIRVPYMGRNSTLRTKEQIEKNKFPIVECYMAVNEGKREIVVDGKVQVERYDIWYARLPETATTPASDWVRANPNNLKGLIEL